MRASRALKSGVVTALVAFLLGGGSTVPRTDSGSPVPGGHVSLAFEPNLGQSDPKVRFLARGTDYVLALTDTGMEARLGSRDAAVIGMTFAGGNPDSVASALGRLDSTSHYFIGSDPSQWQRHVPHFAQVRYDEVYPGIDAVYYGNEGNLEYDLVVEAGVDPSVIALDIHGVDALRIDALGDLVLGSGVHAPVQHRPIVYQVVAGARRLVDGAWRLLDGDTVGFALGAFDGSLPLVIDPVMSYSSYQGGNSSDLIGDVAMDAVGHTWVVGNTDSTDFAGQSGVVLGNGDPGDGYACRFTRLGTPPSCIFVGGSGYDFIGTVAVGDDGSVLLAGTTRSHDFPTANAHQPVLRGRSDMFLVRIDPGLDSMAFGTYLGGGDDDFAVAIDVDASGSTALVGTTQSVDFPTTDGAFQQTNAGSHDVVVAGFAPDGHATFATLLGGSGYESAGGAVVAANGDVLVAGATSSDDFPVLAAFQPASAGGLDAFFARLDGVDGALLQASYLGGESQDAATAIRLDRGGNILLAGSTGQDGFHDARPLEDEPADKGADKGFLAKLTATGDAIAFNALLGNTIPPVADMQLDHAGNAYVVGNHPHWHLNPNFDPQPWAIARTVVAGVSADGRRLLDLHAFEGSTSETTCCIDVDIDGNVLVAGLTNSDDFPLIAALDPSYGGAPGEGDGDSFLTRFSEPVLGHWRGDFNNDGVDDILWRNDATGHGSIWHSANARTAVNLTRVTNLEWRIVGVGDFNGDGASDVLWRNARTGANTIWRSGDFRASQTTTSVTNTNWRVHGIGDFDADGADDIAWHNIATGDTAIWLEADFAQSMPLVRVTNLAWDIVGAGDFDGDGVSDLVWRHALTGENAIWKGGDYRAQLDIDSVGGHAWRIVGIADFQGDGRDDLVWRNMVDGRNVVWASASRAHGETLTGVTRQWWQVSATGDYDGDGKADLLWRDSVHGTNVIWRSASHATQKPVAGITGQAWAPRS